MSRPFDAMRPVMFEPDFTTMALASCLVSFGKTRVLCTASHEDRVPPFRKESGAGWLTAEYAMLPGATPTRNRRASSKGRPDGRSTEIQRLIGRSLRAAFDLDAFGPFSLTIDCDVLQADGGTRTASITGGYVAARIALERLIARGACGRDVFIAPVAAVSVGVVDGVSHLDLDYPLDSAADVDMNVVMSPGGGFIEVQGTAEGAAFGRQRLDELLGLAEKGIEELFALQAAAVAKAIG